MSATERRALLLLLSLGLLGHGVRRWLVPSGAPPGQVELAGVDEGKNARQGRF